MDKVLFLLKVPPPVHGSTLMNDQVAKSEKIKDAFNADYLLVSFSRDIGSIGRVSLRKIFLFLKYSLLLVKKLVVFRPQIVYFAISPYGAAFFKDVIFYLIIRLFSKKVVFHHHGKGVSEHASKSKIYRKCYKVLFLHSYHICLAKELISDINPFYRNKPFIVPNGIKDDVISYNIEIRKKSNSIPRIVYLSNFTRSKGVLEFLQALKALKEEGKVFEFHMIGKPYDVSEKRILNLIQDYNLGEYLNVIGPRYNLEKLNLLVESDFLVFPTYYENETFGLVLLEAMQCGIPVISTFEGGIPSVIKDAETGFLIHQRDVMELVNKMRWLIERPEKCKDMGLRARNDFEVRFTINKFEENIIKVLNELGQV